MKVIDLFAGCGGLSIGFLQAGIKIAKAVEYNEMIANTYKSNHPNVPVIIEDIKNIEENSVFKKGDADVVIGGPPCQGFSMAGARIRSNFIDDPRNYLFKHYYNIVKTVKPKMIIMENVKGIATMQGGKVFAEIINTFQEEGYYIENRVLKATDFGIPQTRERMVIIGVLDKMVDYDLMFSAARDNLIKQSPHFFNDVSVWDAISNLISITPTPKGDVCGLVPKSDYQQYLSSQTGSTTNHTATNHSQIAIDRMKRILNGENFTKLDEDIKSVHSGSYGRLVKHGYAPTITTRFDTPSGGKFIHPTHDRTLTLREAARIQSFPDDYVFYGNKSSVCKQIGNAVPPKLSRFLAELVKEILKDDL